MNGSVDYLLLQFKCSIQILHKFMKELRQGGQKCDEAQGNTLISVVNSLFRQIAVFSSIRSRSTYPFIGMPLGFHTLLLSLDGGLFAFGRIRPT